MFDQSRNKDFVIGAVVGGAVGVLTSLLFTTKKGKQIQRKISETFEDIEENISDKFCDAKDKVEEGVDHLLKKASDAKEKVEEGAEHLHKKAKDTHHKDSK